MSKPAIYEQHDAAFKGVSAYVVMKGEERIATVAFKFPRDGAGRLYCYFHIVGAPMVRAFANGYGYDKKSAAAGAAAERIGHPAAEGLERDFVKLATATIEIKAALKGDSGRDWDRRLEDAGYQVWQAV